MQFALSELTMIVTRIVPLVVTEDEEGTFNVGRNLAIDGSFLKGGILVGDKVEISNGTIAVEDTIKKLLYNERNVRAAGYSEPSDRVTLLLSHVKEKDLPGEISDYTIRKI